MTDAARSTDQPEIPPLAASAEPQAEVAPAADSEAETEDTRTARQRILDHFDDTAEAGDQTVVQILEGTALSRQVVDPLLSRMTKAGVLLRVAQGVYRLAPPVSKPDPLPTPAETARADGVSAGQWLEWLWAWHWTGKWDGPGNPPDRVEGIMTAGCAVPLDVWMTFLGQRDALEKQRAADAELRDRLLLATNNNYVGSARLDDLSAVKVMMASGVDLAMIETVVRAKHDRRSYPKNAPLQSWSDLLRPVAEWHGRFVLGRKLLTRWQERLADPGSTTDASPVLRKALAEIVPEKPVGGSEPVAAVPAKHFAQRATGQSCSQPQATPGPE